MTIAPSPQHIDKTATIEPRTEKLLGVVRQALIMILGALEDYLGMERSIIPRHKR